MRRTFTGYSRPVAKAYRLTHHSLHDLHRSFPLFCGKPRLVEQIKYALRQDETDIHRDHLSSCVPRYFHYLIAHRSTFPHVFQNSPNDKPPQRGLDSLYHVPPSFLIQPI